jgi:hypothetical protein
MFKVHAISNNELEAFLEFQAKISENNLILGKNVVLWVHFHTASTIKVMKVTPTSVLSALLHM